MTLMTNDLNDHFFWRKGEGRQAEGETKNRQAFLLF